MASLASINIKFSADLKEFQTQMQSVQKQFNKLAPRLKQVGTAMSLSVTLPLIALGRQALNTFAEVDSLKRGLEAVMGSAEGAASEFIKLREVAKLPGLGLEEAVKGSVNLQAAGFSADEARASLLSFGNALATVGKGKAELDRVILALTQINNKSTGFGQDLRQLTEQLPQLRGALLSAFGTQNSEEISKLGISGREVVEKLVTEFEKLPKVTGGIKNAFENISDTIRITLASLGDEIDKAVDIQGLLDKLSGFLTFLIDGFKNLSPATKKWIVILAGVAAAIGPLLALAGTILPAIITGFTLLAGPIGLVIAALTAVGVIIYKNWAPIKKTLIDIANYFIDLYNESTVFRLAVQAVITAFKNLFEVGKFIFEALKSILLNFKDNFVNSFKSIGEIFKAVLTGNFKELPDIIANAAKTGFGNFTDFTKNISNDWKNLVTGIKDNYGDAIDAVTTRKKIEFLKENVDASPITDAVSDAVKTGLKEGVKGGVKGGEVKWEGSLESEELSSKIKSAQKFSENPDLKLQLAKQDASTESFLGSMSETMQLDLEKMDTDFNSFLEKFEANAERLKEIGSAVGESVGSAFESLSGRLIDSLGLASSGFQGFVKGLLATVAKLIAMMLSQSIAQSIAGATASGTATGPGAVFATPAFIATAVSGVLAAFAAIPKFATGGVVNGSSFYGDKILARVNSGELILNKEQQQRLYGMLQSGGSDVVTTRQVIEGDKLIIITDRARQKRDRRG